MGLPYMPTLTPQTTPTDRQSYGSPIESGKLKGYQLTAYGNPRHSMGLPYTGVLPILAVLSHASCGYYPIPPGDRATPSVPTEVGQNPTLRSIPGVPVPQVFRVRMKPVTGYLSWCLVSGGPTCSQCMCAAVVLAVVFLLPRRGIRTTPSNR